MAGALWLLSESGDLLRLPAFRQSRPSWTWDPPGSAWWCTWKQGRRRWSGWQTKHLRITSMILYLAGLMTSTFWPKLVIEILFRFLPIHWKERKFSFHIHAWLYSSLWVRTKHSRDGKVWAKAKGGGRMVKSTWYFAIKTAIYLNSTLLFFLFSFFMFFCYINSNYTHLCAVYLWWCMPPPFPPS